MYSVVEVELNGKWAMNMRAALECVQNTGRLRATTLMGLYTRTAMSGNNAEIRDLCSAFTCNYGFYDFADEMELPSVGGVERLGSDVSSEW